MEKKLDRLNMLGWVCEKDKICGGGGCRNKYVRSD